VGGGDGGGQVQGDQAGHQQQDPGEVAGPAQRLRRPGDAAGAGRVVAARPAALVGGSGGQPLEPLVAKQLPDPGAVQRRGRGGQRLLDLGDGVPSGPQPQHLGTGRLLGGSDARPRTARSEEVPVAAPEVAHHRLHARLGVAEPSRRLGGGGALQEVARSAS
jgi:hypothetical protein